MLTEMIILVIYKWLFYSSIIVLFVANATAKVITNSMEQSPSWEANSHSASQEILCLL
jgi:hypothetical protein